MDTMQTMMSRRSTRKYTGEAVPDEVVDKILQAGLFAPTSQNKQTREFYVVRNKETLGKLSKAKEAGAGMLSTCDVAVAVFEDGTKSDTWIEDCSIALSYMSLMATDLGIGNCWCQMHLRSSAQGKDAEDNVRRIMDISNDDLRIVGILALGVPAEELQPHAAQDLNWSKVCKIE